MRGLTLLVLLFFGAFSSSGCQRWRGYGSDNETEVDTALSSPLPASPQAVVPEKPQKGFEQETPKAQNV